MIQDVTPPVTPEFQLTARNVFCFGTHHKTGTVWLGRIVRALSVHLGVPCHYLYPSTPFELGKDRPVFLNSWSSTFPEALLDRADCRIVHLIRDPRDVLISGARYHCKAGPGEKFLHWRRPDLGGASYQEHIAGLDPIEQLRFEMGEKHAETLGQMLAWDYGRENCTELRYERLMKDTMGWFFKRTLRQLGFNEEAAGLGRRIFLRRSLFAGIDNFQDRSEFFKTHVSDGSVAQWRHKLPRVVAEEYAEKYGEALVKLGYEKHPTRWLDALEAS